MPGCSAALAAFMTGSTDLGPIQPQQDSAPLLDDSLFADGGPRRRIIELRQPPNLVRRRMSPPAIVQLTPLWEYVVRTRKFPKNVDPLIIFEEISERLRDAECEVRQHAIRVLVDVLPTIGSEVVDEVVKIVLPDLVDNLGHPAPGVRKGSLDALRIYLLHSSRRDEMTIQVLREGLNRPTGLDDYHTSVATGVILSAPLLLFPSRSSARPSGLVVREAVQALAVRLVQVTQQEAALRSLARIREIVGTEELHGYLDEVDGSMRRNFELLCDVYGVMKNSPDRNSTSINCRYTVRSELRNDGSASRNARRKNSKEVLAKSMGSVEKSWESDDSDTSGIAEEDEDGLRSGSGSVSSARVVLETEIKFNEETAITMTILEEQEKGRNEMETEGEDEEEDEEDDVARHEAEILSEEPRKTPRRVHFGGEVVKLRTPDSEDTESFISDGHQQPLRTRIPVPVSPATGPPRPRARSSSQPISSRKRGTRKRRSASSSPRREIHVHDASLSPKKGILTKSSLFGDRLHSTPELEEPRVRVSRRDSVTFSPRSDTEEPPFRVCEELQSSPAMEVNRSPSPSLLGEACSATQETTQDNIDSIFGDRSSFDFRDKSFKNKENLIRLGYRSNSALGSTSISSFDWSFGKDADTCREKKRRRTQSAKATGFEIFPRQERNYILMELSSPVKELSRRTSIEDNGTSDAVKIETNSLDTDQTESSREKSEDTSDSSKEMVDVQQSAAELPVDSNKATETGLIENQAIVLQEEKAEKQIEIIEEDLEKSALDTRERSSDSSSDGEWWNREPNWEELGIVDDEILSDFHNKVRKQLESIPKNVCLII